MIARTATARAARRLVPFLFVLYVGAYLDRINVGFAQLQMKTALGFGDAVYGFGAGIFFIGYFLFEVPSNVMLARVGARVWIARIMITWAVLSSATAFVSSPMQFYVIRFLLGVAEAGFFPGIIYYLSNWFPATQRAAVVSRFMTAIAVSGIIGGPLSGALLRLHGVWGFDGWQWIFLAEGVPSLILGIAVWKYLPNTPAEASWLTAEERTALSESIRAEQEAIVARGSLRVGSVFTQLAVWRFAVMYFTLLIGMYGVTLWLPQIVKAFSGVGDVAVTLLSAIPYVVAAVVMVLVGSHSDRSGERRMHLGFSALVGAIGLATSAFANAPALGIFALSVAAAGILSALPVFWTLPAAALTGGAAAAAIALINSFGNLGGFVGPYLIGRVREATHGFTGSLLLISCSLLISAVLAFTTRTAPHVPNLESM